MINTTKEDIDFLKDFQNELNTQTDDGNAQPVFWVVAEHKREYDYDPDWADGVIMCGCDDESWDTPEEFLKFLLENNYIKESQIDKDYEYDFDELLNLIDDCDFYIYGYKDSDVIVPDTFFLTKRECEKHIERNSYHYDHPHTYAMTAWRSPEFERFMKLFKNINLDKMKAD